MKIAVVSEPWFLAISALTPAVACAPLATGQIFTWEFIDPGDPSLGRQPSSMLAPDGAGLMPVPGQNWNGRNLTKAWLSGFDLTGLDARPLTAPNADFSGSDLTQSDLTGNLAQSVWESATLDSANIQSANLQGVDLSGVGAILGLRMSTCNLFAANLAGLDLSQAQFFINNDVTGARFVSVNLSGADTRSLIGFTQAQFESTASYQLGQITNWNAQDIDFSRFDFSNLDMTGSSFGGNVSGSVLAANASSTVWANSIVDSVWFRLVDFTDSDLSGLSSFVGANFERADFTRADLSGLDLAEALTFAGANFDEADVSDASLSGSDMVRARNFNEAQFRSTQSYQSGSIVNWRISDTSLIGWDFSGLDLTGSSFGGNVSGSVLAANASSTVWANSIVDSVWFRLVDFTGSDLSGLSSFVGANFERADFTNVNFAGVDFGRDSASWQGARPRHADLRASLNSAELTSRADPASVPAMQSNGVITQVVLVAEELLRIWDFEGVDYGFFPINPTSTYLKTCTDPADQPAAEIIDLAALGFSPGDLITLQASGDFSFDGGPAQNGAGVIGVFSTDGVVEMQRSLADRVPGAIQTDAPGYITINPNRCDTEPTDIPEDFFCDGSFVVEVPDRGNGQAAFLILSADDEFFSDNTDADGNFGLTIASPPEIPIRVQDSFSVPQDSSLSFVFDDASWGSTIRFEPGIPVAIEGTIRLAIDEVVNPSTLVGEEFQLFDFSGVTPTLDVQFQTVGQARFDTSDFASLGVIRVDTPCFADVNGDGQLNGSDFNSWLVSYFTQAPGGDQNGDGILNGADFNAFLTNYAAGCL